MSLEFKISISDATNKKFDFNNYDDFYSFCETEKDWWLTKEKSLKEINEAPVSVFQTASQFNNVLATLNGFKLDEWDQSNLDNQIHYLRNRELSGVNQQWIWSGHPYSEAIVIYNKEYGFNVANSFMIAFLGRQQFSITNKDSLIGTILAYEFSVPDSSITSRTKSELSAMDTVRENIQRSNSELARKLELFKDEFTTWDDSTRSSWADWETEQHKITDDYHNKRREDFISFMDGCRVRIEELENTYQEKLRLEKPAEYWKKSAKKYGLQGSLWALSLVLATLMGIVYFYDFFSSWLLGQKLKVELSSLHGALIFASILTVFAFLIKTLSRLTFSSFHLMRDAEEREQLTYLYLSLNQNSQLDSSSRDIVLQALFSRTDTGLLTGDSSPTMPGLSELIKSTKA